MNKLLYVIHYHIPLELKHMFQWSDDSLLHIGNDAQSLRTFQNASLATCYFYRRLEKLVFENKNMFRLSI